MKIDKISFSAFESEALMRELDGLSKSERDGAEEIIGAYTSLDDIEEAAFSISHGSLTVRCYDGEDYSFSFPYEICEGADLSGAVGAVVRYAMLEEVSPVFEGVPRECLSLFFDLGYRHINLDSDSPDSETYRVTLKSECDLLWDHPEAACEEITLSRIVESDLSDYARLVRDEENNKYWGYDFHEDFSDFEDSFLLELADSEFNIGSTVSLAVRDSGRFVGEAVISSFDYKGGADIAIRILPEHQRKGYAGKALDLVVEIARRIGLVTLYARVFNENLPSLALFSRLSERKANGEGISVFTCDLY